MGPAIGAVICVLVFALPLGLLIGAVILRGGVSFANKCLPQPRSRDWDDEEDDYDWERPARRGRSRSATAIPEPALGKAMGIVFVQFIIGFIISIPINLVMGAGAGAQPVGGRGAVDTAQLLASLIQLPIGFLISAGLRTSMLPTTFPRACLVVLFEYLIVFAIALAIGVPLFFLLAAGRN